MRHTHSLIRSFLSLTIASASIATLGCASKGAETRCNPDVESCGSSTSSSSSTSSTSTGAGGAASTSSSTASTTTGAGGKTSTTTTSSTSTGSGGTSSGTGGTGGGGPVVDAGRTYHGKIVGYLPTWGGAFATWARDLSWQRLTHLNIAFATPSGNTFALGGQEASLAALVTAGHAAGVKVLISIGGANGSDQIAGLYVPGSVDTLVANISSYLTAQNLDGVDVDVEGNAVNANYGPFIDKLVAKLRPQGKLVTSALANWFGNNITNATYAQFDFVNVMSYDHCGTWTAPCEQSTYDAAISDLAFFKNKGVSTDKLILGVPFYGYCWGTSCPGGKPATLPFGQILAQYPNSPDYVQMPNLTISYNSAATVQKKAQLAKMYGGVMAWELTMDAAPDKSLLKIVADNL